MKRVLPLIIIGIVIMILGVTGFSVALYFMFPQFIGGRPTEPAPFTAQQLMDMTDDPDKVKADIPRVIACFKVDDELGVLAADALSKAGPKAVEPLRAKLKDSDARVRYYSALTLALIGPDAKDAADGLVQCLGDDDAQVRQKAAYALGKLGVKSDNVINGLVKALSDKEEMVSTQAIETLKGIGPPTKEALPTLAKLASKDSPQATRELALGLLSQMGEPAAPTFQDLLKNADALATIEIIRVLPAMGKGAKPLLPALQTIMVKDRHWDAEEELLTTFKKCGADGAAGLAKVLKTLHDPKVKETFAPNDSRSISLLKAIGEIGPDAKDTVVDLIVLLYDREGLRPQILQCLGDIGPAAKLAIPDVESMVKNAKDPNDPAIVALRRMGKNVKVEKN